MNTYGLTHFWRWLFLVFTLVAASAGFGASAGDEERKFEVLNIGTHWYTNVTVTSRTPDYIILMHRGGLETIKVGSLSVDVKEQLGYEIPKPKTNTVANWTKAQVSKINAEEVKELQKNWRAHLPPGLKIPKKIHPAFLWVAVAVALFAYFVFCLCGLLICRKTGNEPGVLIWVPVLQMIPLLQAAGMSPVWLLAWLVPVVNLLAQVIWCFKITEKRQKGILTALLLIFPLTSALAFIYLAFSEGPAPKEERPRTPEIMTLEAA